jgi:amidohydrolase
MSKAAILAQYRPQLGPFEDIYRDIHQNPELSTQEARTANIAATHLESVGGYIVHRGIGGHGVVGVLRNGSGPTVMLRADMDALPHLETTNLPYSSSKIVNGPDGKATPVMHACGHDLHTATLMAAALFLHSARSQWSGTLICLFQPNEETAGGAKAMVEDGLYDEEKYGIPVPDIVLAQHVHPIKAGFVALASGPVLTAVDSLEVRIFGKSGHISRADKAVDPVTTAAHVIVHLQSIVTKEVRPEDFAVVACASIHGGTAANIIPEHVDLKLSIRTYQPEVHERVLAAVKRVIRAECEASGSLQIHEPVIKTIMHAPATINDSKMTGVLRTAFKAYFGENLIDGDPFGASEDFSILATACGAPYLFYMYGCVDERTWDEAVRTGALDRIPHNHSSFFAPTIQPTMRTAVDAFALAAMTFFDRL